MLALWCNQDIKLLTTGEDTKNLSWYISNYATKGQKSVYNMSSLIAKHMAYEFEEMDIVCDSHERLQLMLFQCLRVTNWEQEQSGPQVISYLMEWGD